MTGFLVRGRGLRGGGFRLLAHVRRDTADTADQIDGLLTDHDGGRIGVAADQGRHDRCIDNTQPIQAVHAQLRVDHGHLVLAHAAGADGVIDGIGALPQDGADVVVGLHV